MRHAIPPAVANGVIYIGSYFSSLNALNASTGALLWSTSLIEGSSPTAVNGVVYTGTGFKRILAFSLQ
jgi:outer membrane protein assembly factor BamB